MKSVEQACHRVIALSIPFQGLTDVPQNQGPPKKNILEMVYSCRKTKGLVPGTNFETRVFTRPCVCHKLQVLPL